MLVWQILLLCVFCVLVTENAAINGCPVSEIACLCGEKPNSEIITFEIQPEFFNDKVKDCRDRSSEACANHSCLFAPTVASESETGVEDYVSFNPITLTFPPLDEAVKESHSKLRHHGIPMKSHSSISSIENAIMECSVRPGSVSCEINCIHGHAMEEGREVVLKTTREYRESERAWHPNATFPVCKPFINCKAVLSNPGYLDCKISGPMISYCDISCEADYEHDEVSKKRYECIDEHFADTLPHCATVTKGVDLIPPPRGP